MLKGFRTYICLGSAGLVELLNFIITQLPPTEIKWHHYLQAVVGVLLAAAGYFRSKASPPAKVKLRHDKPHKK